MYKFCDINQNINCFSRMTLTHELSIFFIKINLKNVYRLYKSQIQLYNPKLKESLVLIIYRALHEKEVKSKWGITRNQFFVIALVTSFSYYILPGYLFSLLTTVSWLCWIRPKSILVNQLGSGSVGLGIGAFGLDWATIASYLGSPLASPFFATANIAVGFFLLMYVITPLSYYLDFFHARTFPIYSGKLFVSNGQEYKVRNIINDEFRLDHKAYAEAGPVHMSTFFAVSYGLGFATLTASVVHVLLFDGKDLWNQSKGVLRGNKKMDIHTKIMKRNYKEVPLWWFLSIFAVNIAVVIFMCFYYKTQIQLPWWGAFLACLIAIFFTPLVGVIKATTNQV